MNKKIGELYDDDSDEAQKIKSYLEEKNLLDRVEIVRASDFAFIAMPKDGLSLFLDTVREAKSAINGLM